MEPIEYKEIIGALSMIMDSLYRNCIPITINFMLWFSGIVIFYFSLRKVKNNQVEFACKDKNTRVSDYLECAKRNGLHINQTKRSFELLRKSEWVYFFFLLISTAFLLIIEAFLTNIPISEIPESSISLYNVVYLLLSILIPQVSRINTYIQFNLNLK